MKVKKIELNQRFEDIFGEGPEPGVYRAPGRVNLIGEHTDYNDGLVLPIAINLSTYGLFRSTGKDRVRLYSENLNSSAEVPLDQLSRRRGDWTDYVSGVLAGLEELGEAISGFDFYLNSEIPVGSGLSSSAALEVVTAVGAIRTLNLDTPEDLELIGLCQRAENEFVGANTGIMDQYASYLGKDGEALMINTAIPSHESINMALEGYEVLVIDTTVSHTHGDNEYNRRRSECESALEGINKASGGRRFDSLSQIPLEELEDLTQDLNGKLANRAEHIVRENRRVERAAELFRRGEIEEVGELFYVSHSSLRDLYEVSSPELDFLVEFARSEGIPGARMTGGGFGGSTVHLVPEGRTDGYLEKASRRFEEEFGLSPAGFLVSPSDGAKFQNPVFPK